MGARRAFYILFVVLANVGTVMAQTVVELTASQYGTLRGDLGDIEAETRFVKLATEEAVSQLDAIRILNVLANQYAMMTSSNVEDIRTFLISVMDDLDDISTYTASMRTNISAIRNLLRDGDLIGVATIAREIENIIARMEDEQKKQTAVLQHLETREKGSGIRVEVVGGSIFVDQTTALDIDWGSDKGVGSDLQPAPPGEEPDPLEFPKGYTNTMHEVTGFLDTKEGVDTNFVSLADIELTPYVPLDPELWGDGFIGWQKTLVFEYDIVVFGRQIHWPLSLDWNIITDALPGDPDAAIGHFMAFLAFVFVVFSCAMLCRHFL